MTDASATVTAVAAPTIVWPLGHWLTHQQIVSRQALGAGVIVVGLAMFVLVGDPDAGVDSAATRSLVIAALVICAVVGVLLLWLRTKPVVEDLHVSIADAAEAWQTWALLGFGFIAFVLQRLSLATGQLAPAMAAVSVANPAVSVILLITLANRETRVPGVDEQPA